MAKLSEGLRMVTGIKYLEILEADDVKHSDMKVSISREYLRRVGGLLSLIMINSCFCYFSRRPNCCCTGSRNQKSSCYPVAWRAWHCSVMSYWFDIFGWLSHSKTPRSGARMGCLFKEVQEFQDRLVVKYSTISGNKLSATKCSRTNSTSSFSKKNSKYLKPCAQL